MIKKTVMACITVLLTTVIGCAGSHTTVDSEKVADSSPSINDISEYKENNISENISESINIPEDKKLELTKNYKTRGNSNPIMTQAFGADPFALVVDDTIYIYMTADALEYDSKGNVVENTYRKINTIHVVSTKDMKNFEDHGEINVAGPNGAAKWAHNSWAPAAAHKVIDGKDKFFLYFADNGGGIGVLSADSPIGPFEDPIGKALISRPVPTCDSVLWLFDPAVIVDDDGTGYIYFGGGVPEGKVPNPGTGRVCKLGADMISLDGDPVPLDVPYLFEDSGIHKYNNKYYYTYCTNWNVDDEGTKKYGFTSGNIAMLESDSPMGPFKYSGKILDNPGTLCGLYGNNHHAIFEFKGNYYVVYHSRMLEKNMGIEHGYRATFINRVKIKEDGSIGTITQTVEGPDQLVKVNPYESHSAVCVSQMAGCDAVSATNMSYGLMKLGEINTGDYIEVTGVDFGEDTANTVTITADVPDGATGTVYVKLDYVNRDSVAIIPLNKSGDNVSFTANLTAPVSGEHFLYFVFEGESYEIKSFCFTK